MSEGLPQGPLSSLTSLSILSEDNNVPMTDLKDLEMWLAGEKKLVKLFRLQGSQDKEHTKRRVPCSHKDSTAQHEGKGLDTGNEE